MNILLGLLLSNAAGCFLYMLSANGDAMSFIAMPFIVGFIAAYWWVGALREHEEWAGLVMVNAFASSLIAVALQSDLDWTWALLMAPIIWPITGVGTLFGKRIFSRAQFSRHSS